MKYTNLADPKALRSICMHFGFAWQKAATREFKKEGVKFPPTGAAPLLFLSSGRFASSVWLVVRKKTQTNSALLAWDAMHCAGQEKPMQEKVIRQTVGSDSSLLLLPPSPLLASVPPNTHQLLAFSSCFLFWSDWKNSWPFSSRPAFRMSSTSVSSLPSTA